MLEDESYLGAYYACPWYAFPGSEGVAVTDLIAAALENVSGGAEVDATVTDLAETLRMQLGMK